jgi:hypothetical protein
LNPTIDLWLIFYARVELVVVWYMGRGGDGVFVVMLVCVMMIMWVPVTSMLRDVDNMELVMLIDVLLADV